MENNNCVLQMNDLFFSKFDFVQTRGDTNTDYETSFRIEYAANNQDSAKFRVTILTLVKNKTESMHVNLETVGIFTIDSSENDKNLIEHLLKENTVAIMLPFIRSQISLLTTQPGLSPVMLPPINVNALLDSTEEKE